MNTDTTAESRAPGWVPVQACTLPTGDQPLRLAEFDDLFASTLNTIERLGETRARLVLAGETWIADRVQRLVDAESSCCSFFTFAVSKDSPGVVTLDIEVPSAYATVLAGLLARAESSQGGAS